MQINPQMSKLAQKSSAKKIIIISALALAGLFGGGYFAKKYYDNEQEKRANKIKTLETKRDNWANLSEQQRDSINSLIAHIIRVDPVAAKLNKQILAKSERLQIVQDTLNGSNNLSSDTVAWKKFGNERDKLRTEIDSLSEKFGARIMDSKTYQVKDFSNEPKKSGSAWKSGKSKVALKTEINRLYTGGHIGRIQEILTLNPDSTLIAEIPDGQIKTQLANMVKRISR